MEIQQSDPAWDEAEDKSLWFQFLQTRTGQRLFAKALDDSPTLLAKGTDSEIFIRSGECRGWSAAIQTLLMLATGAPKPAESQSDLAYPPLDQDHLWRDGQTVNIPAGNPTT